ncbi:MAG TPA: hypothetical protein VFY89_01880, partial [Ktedonobacterales bacterium]
ATSLQREPPTPEAARAALADLAARGRAVAALATLLGLDTSRLAAAEALDRLEVLASLPTERALAWAATTLYAALRPLGDDATLTLALVGADGTQSTMRASLRGDTDPAKPLGAFQRAIQPIAAAQGEAVRVEARLAVGKRHALATARALLAMRGADDAAATSPVVFYSSAAWARFLSLGHLPLWEARGLLTPDQRACVVLCDAAGYLAGSALEIVGAGGAEPPRWRVVTRGAWRQFCERAGEYERLHAEESHWSAQPLALTPAHLWVEARAPGLEETAHRLAGLRAALAAADLASTVQGTWEDGLALRFASPRPASCLLTPEAPRGLAAPDAAPEALARLARWAFAHGSPDKLAIARECLARELPSGGAVTLAALAEAAAPALEAAKANFALYLRGKTAQYFTLRQAAYDAVAAYAEGVRKTVAELTGDAVESAYRTAGLAVALFLAWLIQPAASLWALRLGLLLFSLYLGCLVLLPLRARQERYDLERRALRERLAAMPELTTTERARLRAAAEADDAYFARYARWVRRLYLALLVVGLLALLVFCTPLASHLLPPTHP